MKDTGQSLDFSKVHEIAGFVGAALVDGETGLMLSSQGGGGIDLEASSARIAEVVKAKQKAIEEQGFDDWIEDFLITLGRQYHLVRPIQGIPGALLYLVLDRQAANPGMARLQLKKIEAVLTF